MHQKTGMESYSPQLPSLASDYYPRYIPDGSKIILDVGGGDGNALAKYAQEILILLFFVVMLILVI